MVYKEGTPSKSKRMNEWIMCLAGFQSELSYMYTCTDVSRRLDAEPSRTQQGVSTYHTGHIIQVHCSMNHTSIRYIPHPLWFERYWRELFLVYCKGIILVVSCIYITSLHCIYRHEHHDTAAASGTKGERFTPRFRWKISHHKIRPLFSPAGCGSIFLNY